MVLNDSFGEQTGSRRPFQKKALFLSVAFFLGIFFPLTSSAAPLSYLKQNAPDFAEQAKNDYGEMINIASLLHDYDKNMILAVIVVESEGKQSAVSHKGARGLMQLMPGTARAMGAKDPNDPFQNILAGTKYLKELDERYGFDMQEALVAYNMGPTRAKRWLSQYSAEDYLYVKKVMYVYNVLEKQEEENRRIAEAVAQKVSLGSDMNDAHPLLMKPRNLSLAELPITLPSGRRNETRDEN